MIYALLDKNALLKKGVSLGEISQKIEKMGVPIAQYRNKSGSIEQMQEDLSIIRLHFRGQLIINDNIELIEFSDGLHLGQEDIRKFNPNLKDAVNIVRQRIGRKILGLSTHNREEILEANGLDLDYIGLGAYRGTSTKSNVNILGKQALELAKLSKHPVGLIGGVKLDDSFGNEIKYSVIGSDLYKK